MKYLPLAWQYLRPHRSLAGFSVALMIIGAAASLLAPWPLKILIDNVLDTKPLPTVLHDALRGFSENRHALLIIVVVGGFLVTLLQSVLNVIENYVNTKIDQNMTLDFRSDMFQHVQCLSLAHHDQRRSGQLIYAINYMADAPARLMMTIPPFVQSVLTLIGMLCITMLMDPVLALISLAVVPPLYYSVGYYVKRIQPRLYEVKGMEGESLSIIHEAISMMRVIVAFAREQFEFRKFRSQGERTIDARIKLTVRQTLFSMVVNCTTAAGTALVLGIGAMHVLQGRLTVGQLTVVLGYIGAIYKPLEAISTTIGSLQDVFVNLKIATDIMQTRSDIQDQPGALVVQRSWGSVGFKSVSFSYSGRVDTLKNISFKAQPGHVIAIVGPTGAGKTTLVSLLPRFYAATGGTITLDDIDIRKYQLKSLREQISIVLQEPLLFSTTVAENIRYGRLDATMEEIMDAAKAANAHEFIMRLPKQYDTELGERGAKMSGGERQRISVARAFLKDAPILILDEPTSSIDSKTEAVILDALDRLMVGRTTFMIAHRLSTLRRVDRILVLDNGRLVEQGTHEELMEQGGLYRHLYDMQTRHVRQRQA